jgi:preprotein translocase subunit SecG
VRLVSLLLVSILLKPTEQKNHWNRLSSSSSRSNSIKEPHTGGVCSRLQLLLLLLWFLVVLLLLLL